MTNYFVPPFGAAVVRTGWEEGLASPSVVAEMKVQVYNFSNHQHLDAGGFQLYYKGPLTVQSGIYQGKGGTYGDEHFKNYAQRSISSNTMLIYDPAEKFTWHGLPILNDGGQPFPNGGHEPENLKELVGQGYQTGEVLSHSFGPDPIVPDYTYLKGDLTKAYSSKVKSFRRSFVFLNLKNATMPAALIVFDNVTAADKNFKKYWLLHCVEEPAVKGIYTTVTRTEKGYNGKMINTTLLPLADNVAIEKVGGKGKEYDVFGMNFPHSVINPATSSEDSAVWRIQVSPKVPSANNLFLNVMQVMDNGVNPSAKALPEKIETTEFTGTKIGDRIVLFSKNSDVVRKQFGLTITGSGDYKILITDVGEGTWKVKSKSLSKEIKNDSGVLYFTVKAGNYLISKN